MFASKTTAFVLIHVYGLCRWGAPGPLYCGPKSLYPQTGYWDFLYTCDDKWANPPLTCDAYDGQLGGKAINDEPYPNAAVSE